MTTGEKICKYRKALGISQEELATKLNVTRQSVSLWETDQTLPATENLIALSKLFSISLNELCENDFDNMETISKEKKDNNESAKSSGKVKKAAIIGCSMFVIVGLIISTILLTQRKAGESNSTLDSNSDSISLINSSTSEGPISSVGNSISSVVNSNEETSITSSDEISIAEVNAKGALISVDYNGNGIDEEIISFKGVFVLDYIDGTRTDRIGLFTDGTETIYVRIKYEDKEYEQTYIKNETYIIKGNLTKYYHHLEMSIMSTWTVSSDKLTYDIKTLAKPNYLEILNDKANALKPRDQGAIFTEVVKFTARYIAKTDNTMMLMYDGRNVITVHGDKYINNVFIKGNHYTIYGIIGKYNGMPLVEFITSEFYSIGTMNEVNYLNGDTTSITLSEIFKKRPKSWECEYFPYVLTSYVYVDVNARTVEGQIDKNNDRYRATKYLLKESINGRISWQSESYYAQAVVVNYSADYLNDGALRDAYTEDLLTKVTFVVYRFDPDLHMWYVHLLDPLFEDFPW